MGDIDEVQRVKMEKMDVYSTTKVLRELDRGVCWFFAVLTICNVRELV